LSLELKAHPDRDWPQIVAAGLGRFLAAKPGARVCLATGRTTSAVYQRTTITGSPQLFLLDEFGGLDPGDPARCANMLQRDLPNVPFLGPDVDDPDPEAAAAVYARKIADGGLDLAVVGLGVNGHIGMNERR
jgi:glucosamine-6-phosphate deaminase